MNEPSEKMKTKVKYKLPPLKGDQFTLHAFHPKALILLPGQGQ